MLRERTEAIIVAEAAESPEANLSATLITLGRQSLATQAEVAYIKAFNCPVSEAAGATGDNAKCDSPNVCGDGGHCVFANPQASTS